MPSRSKSQLAAKRRLRIMWTIITILLVSAMVLSLVATLTTVPVQLPTPTPVVAPLPLAP